MTATPIQPYQTIDELHQAATDAFCELATKCIATKGKFSVSLSGGSTPKRLYELLSQRDLPWSQIHWFWGDERNVPHDHADSNYRMVCEAILNHIPVAQENIHAVQVQSEDPAAAAQAYEADLRQFFRGDSFPSWDLVLLGMGDDAHTASLFPKTKALSETNRWFVENWVEKFQSHRYTLTAPAINSAHNSWFLIAGAAEQPALANVLGEEDNPHQYPSQMIKPTRWFITADAMLVNT